MLKVHIYVFITNKVYQNQTDGSSAFVIIIDKFKAGVINKYRFQSGGYRNFYILLKNKSKIFIKK